MDRKCKKKHTVNNHNIPLPNPLLPQHTGQNLNLIEQLRIGILLYSFSHGRLPNNRNIAATARMHMSIDAVVRGADLAIRKPRPMLMLHPAGEGFGAPSQRA